VELPISFRHGLIAKSFVPGSVANFLGGHATSEDAEGFIPPAN
jgi:hypothetical protein